MRAFLFFVALGGALAVAACAPKSAHEKAYFIAHPDERAATLAECRKDPGKLQETPNCINAYAASADADSDRFWAPKTPRSRVANPGSL